MVVVWMQGTSGGVGGGGRRGYIRGNWMGGYNRGVSGSSMDAGGCGACGQQRDVAQKLYARFGSTKPSTLWVGHG